jgi:phage tail protein X
MESMERNWLIRTTQNQVLGPVAKQKLLEFIEKGALGLNDEVTSGNGYWFSLREKELVDKYIYGDIPQGYNPISESKSVLAKLENPEKTTSINTAPANRGQLNKPEAKEGPVILPNSSDLEFPDMGIVSSALPASQTSQVDPTDVTILPSADDLEFPDITLVTTSKPQQVSDSQGNQTVILSSSAIASLKKEKAPEIQAASTEGPAVYPKNEDLDFPDIDIIKSALKEEEKDKTGDFEFKIDTSVTQTIAVKKEHIEAAVNQPPKKTTKEVEAELSDFGENTLTLIQTKFKDEKKDEKKEEKKEPPLQINRREAKKESQREQTVRDEDKKLLHDRKVKPAQPKTLARENREVVNIESAPAPLRKRNDNYIFFILIILVLILLAVFFYFKEILNKPLPV